mgnify:CR=1 FL=1
MNMILLLLEIVFKVNTIRSVKPESIHLTSEAEFNQTVFKLESEGFQMKDVQADFESDQFYYDFDMFGSLTYEIGLTVVYLLGFSYYIRHIKIMKMMKTKYLLRLVFIKN